MTMECIVQFVCVHLLTCWLTQRTRSPLLQLASSTYTKRILSHTHTHIHIAHPPSSLSNAPSSPSISLSHSLHISLSLRAVRSVEQHNRVECVFAVVCVCVSTAAIAVKTERERQIGRQKGRERDIHRGRTERTERKQHS